MLRGPLISLGLLTEVFAMFSRRAALLSLVSLAFLSGCDDTPAYNGPGLPKDYVKYKPPANPVAQLDIAAGDIKGSIKIELFESDVPITVTNFIQLIKEGKYKGTQFHRIIKDFMIQGGDPKGDGTGGPGYKFADEFKRNDPKANKHEQYSVSMANSGPDTNGSAILYRSRIPRRSTAHLNGKHTVFGKVIEGKELVDKLNVVATEPGDKPKVPVVIVDAKILSDRGHEYKMEESDKIQDRAHSGFGPGTPIRPRTFSA